MNTPTERLEAFNINYDHLARIMEAKRSQPTSTIRPTMTYRVDASREQFPKWRKLKLNKSKFAIE
jgi:hypothetical protein